MGVLGEDGLRRLHRRYRRLLRAGPLLRSRPGSHPPRGQLRIYDPSCALANALAAHFVATKIPEEASHLLHAATASLDNAPPYKRAVVAAISCLLGDNKDEEMALGRHVEELCQGFQNHLLNEFPKDLLSLKRVQILCFYLGRAAVCLSIVQQRSRKFHGRLLFLMEFLFIFHVCTQLVGHVVVCYLEGESPLNKVLETYDQNIWKELQRTDAEPVEVYINALWFLLRIHLHGHTRDIAEWLKFQATALKDKSMWLVEWLLDILALWALACTNERNEAEELLDSIKSRFSTLSSQKQQSMRVAIQLAQESINFFI